MIFKNLFQAAPSHAGAVDVQAAQAKLAAGDALLVDVREAAEWQAGHVAGAMHLPLGTLPEAASTLPKDRELLVICHTGRRSALAQERLTQAGFMQVTNVTGGMTAWTEHGLPITGGVRGGA